MCEIDVESVNIQRVTDVLKSKYQKFKEENNKIITIYGIDIEKIIDKEALLGAVIIAYNQKLNILNMFNKEELRG